MTKIAKYILVLIMIDILFIITGQICNDSVGCSLNSIIFNTILNISSILTLSFWTEMIGAIGNLFTSATGLGSIIVGATVIVGALALIPSEQRLFIPMAFSLGLLSMDFVFIGTYLISLNVVLGTLIIVPIIILYTFQVVEWLRGKDT